VYIKVKEVNNGKSLVDLVMIAGKNLLGDALISEV
jgi:hypothetical protein